VAETACDLKIGDISPEFPEAIYMLLDLNHGKKKVCIRSDHENLRLDGLHRVIKGAEALPDIEEGAGLVHVQHGVRICGGQPPQGPLVKGGIHKELVLHTLRRWPKPLVISK